jgi:hypothetical protein
MYFRIGIWLALIGWMAVPAHGLSADRLVETTGQIRIDWRQGIVAAVGTSIPSKKDFGKTADRRLVFSAARAAADRNLAAAVQSIRLSGEQTVGQVTAHRPAVMDKIVAMIAGVDTAKQEYLSDGTVTVTVRMSLFKGLSQLVLPPEIQQVEPIRPVAAAPAAGPAPDGKGETAAAGTDVYSGLLVDVRGLALFPALVVRIQDEGGQPVYGPAFVSREHAVQRGMCGYTRDMAAARKESRLGGRPLVVKGLKILGGANVVIGNADAAKLRGAGEHLSFLRQCRVVMVLE